MRMTTNREETRQARTPELRPAARMATVRVVAARLATIGLAGAALLGLVVLMLIGAAAAARAVPAGELAIRPVAGLPAQQGGAASFDQVLTNLRNWMLGILASLATVFLTIGGFRYIWGGGDPGEIEKAKAAFRAAALGYGLAVLAPLVVTVLRGIVGGP